jgi:hypothetical protein
MDEDLLRVIFILGSYIAILDIFKIHRNHRLCTEAVVNIYLHHILVVGVIVGSFFKNIFLQKFHLATCLLITTMWFMNRGCIMTKWQYEVIPYTKADKDELDGDFYTQMINHLFIMVPVVFYDFYKILM